MDSYEVAALVKLHVENAEHEQQRFARLARRMARVKRACKLAQVVIEATIEGDSSEVLADRLERRGR